MAMLCLWHCCVFSIQIPVLRAQHQPRTIAAFAQKARFAVYAVPVYFAAFASRSDCFAKIAAFQIALLLVRQLLRLQYPKSHLLQLRHGLRIAAFAAPLTSELNLLHL
jgi:hypothetical protein